MRTILLACYQPHAIKGLIAGSDREAAVRALLESVGGELVSMMFTRGEYDIAVVSDIPDRNAGMGLTMAIQASGAFSKISVLRNWTCRRSSPRRRRRQRFTSRRPSYRPVFASLGRRGRCTARMAGASRGVLW